MYLQDLGSEVRVLAQVYMPGKWWSLKSNVLFWLQSVLCCTGCTPDMVMPNAHRDSFIAVHAPCTFPNSFGCSLTNCSLESQAVCRSSMVRVVMQGPLGKWSRLRPFQTTAPCTSLPETPVAHILPRCSQNSMGGI